MRTRPGLLYTGDAVAATNGTNWGSKTSWSGAFQYGLSVSASGDGTAGIVTNTSLGSVSGDWEYINYINITADRDTTSVAFMVGNTAPTLVGWYAISLRSSFNAVNFNFLKNSMEYNGAGGTVLGTQNWTHTSGTVSAVWIRVVKTGSLFEIYVDVVTAVGGTPTWIKLTTLSRSDSSYSTGHMGFFSSASWDAGSIPVFYPKSFTPASSGSVIPQIMANLYRVRAA